MKKKRKQKITRESMNKIERFRTDIKRLEIEKIKDTTRKVLKEFKTEKTEEKE